MWGFRAQGKGEARAGRYSELQMQKALKDAEGRPSLGPGAGGPSHTSTGATCVG
jgi:hypothetical protein